MRCKRQIHGICENEEFYMDNGTPKTDWNSEIIPNTKGIIMKHEKYVPNKEMM